MERVGIRRNDGAAVLLNPFFNFFLKKLKNLLTKEGPNIKSTS